MLIRLAVIERSAAQPIDSAMNRAIMDDLRRWKDRGDTGLQWNNLAPINVPTGEWRQYAAYTQMGPSSTADNVRGYVYLNHFEPGEAVYIDDVRLIELGETREP